MREIKYSIEDTFEVDGSLRDILIKNTGIEDWDRLIQHLKNNEIDFNFIKDGEPSDLRDIQAYEIFKDNEDQYMMLQIKVGGLTINCHFFCIEEIEMDIDPSDIKDVETAEKIYGFLENLALAIGKDVLLTPEGIETAILARFCPEV